MSEFGHYGQGTMWHFVLISKAVQTSCAMWKGQGRSGPGPALHWSQHLELGWDLTNTCVEHAGGSCSHPCLVAMCDYRAGSHVRLQSMTASEIFVQLSAMKGSCAIDEWQGDSIFNIKRFLFQLLG